MYEHNKKPCEDKKPVASYPWKIAMAFFQSSSWQRKSYTKKFSALIHLKNLSGILIKCKVQEEQLPVEIEFERLISIVGSTRVSWQFTTKPITTMKHIRMQLKCHRTENAIRHRKPIGWVRNVVIKCGHCEITDSVN